MTCIVCGMKAQFHNPEGIGLCDRHITAYLRGYNDAMRKVMEFSMKEGGLRNEI